MESGKKYVFVNNKALVKFRELHSSNGKIIALFYSKGYLEATGADGGNGVALEDPDNICDDDNYIEKKEYEFFKEKEEVTGVSVETETRVVINTTITKETYEDLITLLRTTFE